MEITDVRISLLNNVNSKRKAVASIVIENAFADYVFNRMLTELQTKYSDLQKGEMFWKADNFHVYPRHFKYLE